MKELKLLIFLIAASATAAAQNSISGAFVDSLSLQGVPYATAAITLKGQTSPEKVVLTDMDGKFSFTAKRKGTYVLSITEMTYRKHTQEVTTNGSPVDLGNILALAKVEALNEVAVIAQKPLIKAEIDKITYDVENDPDAEVNNALDMLRKMPLVTVDGSDNIQLNGSSDFEFQLNGHETSMFDDDPGKILKGIPATAIKNIEIITSPGAKYDAEGTGGIINIEMATNASMDGYNLSLNLTGQTPNTGFNGGGNFIFKKGKFTMSGRAFTHYEDSEPTKTWSNIDYVGADGVSFDGQNRVESYSESDNTRRFTQGSVEMSLEIDSLRLLTASWNRMGGKFENNTDLDRTVQFSEGDTLYYALNSESSEHKRGRNQVTLDYERKFANDRALTLSYNGRYAPDNGGPSERAYQAFQGDIPRNVLGLKSDNVEKHFNHSVRADFSGSINEAQSFEAGVKYDLRIQKSDSWNDYFFLDEDYSEASNEPDSATTYKLDYRMNIFSAYASWQMKIKTFSFKLGLRSETAALEATSTFNGEDTDFSYDETDLVPSVYTALSMGPTQTMKLSYNMRIMRPRVNRLNPYREESTYSVSYGNPDLDSEHHHNLSLSYSNFGQRVMVNAEVRYRFCNNKVVEYNNTVGYVIESTYANIGEQNTIGLNLFANLTLSKTTSLFLNAGLDYVDINSPSLGLSNDGWENRGFMGLNQELPGKIQLGIHGGMHGERVQLQSEESTFYFYGMDLHRGFLKDRLTLSASARHFIKDYFVIDGSTESEGVRSSYETHIPMRHFQVGLSFRIGDFKGTVRKAERGLKGESTTEDSGSSTSTGSYSTTAVQ